MTKINKNQLDLSNTDGNTIDASGLTGIAGVNRVVTVQDSTGTTAGASTYVVGAVVDGHTLVSGDTVLKTVNTPVGDAGLWTVASSGNATKVATKIGDTFAVTSGTLHAGYTYTQGATAGTFSNTGVSGAVAGSLG